jgi:hypothetical protein
MGWMPAYIAVSNLLSMISMVQSLHFPFCRAPQKMTARTEIVDFGTRL